MKKLIVTMILTVLMLSPLNNLALAAPEAQQNLTQAITIAKDHFTIPAEMDDLSSNYYDIDGNPYWQLYWKSSMLKKTLRVTVDMKRQEIVQYNYYNYEKSENESYLPKLNRDEGMAVALTQIQELTGFTPEDLIDISYNDTMPLQQGEKYYYFTFAQLVGGIPYYNNQIDISVDADTGAIRRFDKEWTYGLTYPKAINMTLEQVAKLFGKQAGLQLTYIKKSNEENEDSLILVYEGRYASQFIIDADTGELLEIPTNYYYNKVMNEATDQVVGMGEQVLSPYELEEVDKYADLISQEKAIEQVATYFKIPENYSLTRANIMRDYAKKERFLWRLTFTNETEDPEISFRRQGDLCVSVDAVTGKLIDYSHYNYHDEPIEPSQFALSDAPSAQQLAEHFISDYYPALLDEVKCASNPLTPDVLEAKESYSFHFIRQIDEADYPSQGFYVNVDAVDGRVISFRINWDDLEFPKQSQRLSCAEMLTTYLKQNPITMQYVNVAKYNEAEDIRLAYLIEENVPYFEANTGAKLNTQGQPIVEEQRIAYQDLSNHWIEDEVLLLQQFDLLPFTGDRFEPSKAMTCSEWVEMIYHINNNHSPEPIEPAKLIVFATDYQLYPDDLESFRIDEPLTRQDMAQILVNYMGYQAISRLNIYTVPFTDADTISEDRLGAVAICNGMDLMKGINQAFQPERAATRAEAVSTLVRFLK